MKNKTLLITVIVLLVVMGVAAVLYPKLSAGMQTQQIASQGDDIADTAACPQIIQILGDEAHPGLQGNCLCGSGSLFRSRIGILLQETGYFHDDCCLAHGYVLGIHTGHIVAAV